MKHAGVVIGVVAIVVAAMALAKRAPVAPKKAGVISSSPPARPALPAAAAKDPALTEPAPTPPPIVPTDPVYSLLAKLLEAVRNGDREAVEKLTAELYKSVVPPPIPDEENGVFAYQKAFEKMSVPTTPEADAIRALRDGTITPAQVALLEALVERNRDVLEMLKAAGSWTKARWPVDYEKGFDAELPHIAKVMRAGQILEAEGFLLRRMERDDTASLAAAGRLADTMANEPLLISQLVRDVVLQQAGIGDLSTIRSAYGPALRMEIAAALGWGLRELPADRWTDPQIRLQGEHYLESMSEALRLVPQPWYQSHEAMDALMERVQNGDWRAEGSKMLMPAINKVNEAAAKTEVALGAGIDPFSGKPMLRRGTTVYSVGPNGRDDGGDPALDVVVRRK